MIMLVAAHNKECRHYRISSGKELNKQQQKTRATTTNAGEEEEFDF